MATEKEIEEAIETANRIRRVPYFAETSQLVHLSDAYLSMKSERDAAISELSKLGKQLGTIQDERDQYKEISRKMLSEVREKKFYPIKE